MPKTIRAFIALELPPPVKDELKCVTEALADQFPPRVVRWVPVENMHLTCRFLGDTAVAQLPAIREQLEVLAGRCEAFTLQLAGLGCFPNRKRLRVLWVGVQGQAAALQALKRALDERLAPLGWEPEKRTFRAHLTVGRVKDKRQAAQINWQYEVQPVSFTVTAVHLIESQLRPQGPLYSKRHTVVLK